VHSQNFTFAWYLKTDVAGLQRSQNEEKGAAMDDSTAQIRAMGF